MWTPHAPNMKYIYNVYCAMGIQRVQCDVLREAVIIYTRIYTTF